MIAAEIDRFAAGDPLVQRRQPGGALSNERAPARDRRRHRLAAGPCSSTPTARQVAIGQREYSHAAEPGVPGSQVFDTAAQLAADLRLHPRGARAGRGRRVGDPRGQHHEHARGHGALRRRRARDLGLPERRLASRRPRPRSSSGRAPRRRSTSAPATGSRSPRRRGFAGSPATSPRSSPASRHVGMLGDWVLTRLSGEFVDRPVARARARACSTSPRRTGRTTIARARRARCGAGRPPGPRAGHGRRRGDGRRGRRDRARRRARRSSSAAPTRSSGCSGSAITRPAAVTVVGGTFWQHTVVLDEPLIDPAGAPPDALPRRPGHVDDRGDRLLLRASRCAGSATPSAPTTSSEAADAVDDVYDAPGRAGRRRPARARTACFGDLLERDARQPLGPGVAGVRRLRHRRPRSGPARTSASARSRRAAAYVSRGHLRDHRGARPAHGSTRSCSPAARRKGALWPQIVADVLGVPVRVPVVKESTALGAAIYAGRRRGRLRDVARGRRPARPLRAHGRAEPGRRRGVRAISTRAGSRPTSACSSWRADGVVRPLWRAAGT